ncbi:MAG: metallophosphoesterase [Deltaproteobacteria bacterium]|nr:metallophosphoesterase [Deltaproteobacteria bacterium]MCW5801692.1 metallophosphoesterase [Deltaproteobacteria bacterium]
MQIPRSAKRAGAGAMVVASVLAACTFLNHHGHTSASKLGDTTHPAERGSPTEALVAACGASGELTLEGRRLIGRRPYLQQVTATGALVGLVASPHALFVDVTLPDGTSVTSAPAEIEETRTEPAQGRRQMWAKLDGLEPDTTYCYTLGNTSGDLSERIGFRTAPAADDTRPIRILAVGDSGSGDGEQHLLFEQMKSVPWEMMIHTGDIAYDTGTLAQFEDHVFGVYGAVLRHLPLFPSPGNHDYKQLDGAAYRDVFNLPGDSGERWYSYDWGRIHFAALDTNSDYTTQAAWLDADLAATDLPWRIVYLHAPPYSSGNHGSDTRLRAALAPVLEKHGVQLVLAGHDHDYERMHPQRGTYYIVTGGGGRGTYSVGESSFTAFSEEVIHFTYLEVGVDEMIVHAIDATGTEFDSVVIPRTREL